VEDGARHAEVFVAMLSASDCTWINASLINSAQVFGDTVKKAFLTRLAQ
jgi:hypothetical protein